MRKFPEKHHHCYCIVMRQATNAVTKFYDKKLEPYGLTISQFSLLEDIAYLGVCSKTELSEYAKLDKSTIARNLKILRDKGLVEDLAANGQRSSEITLTDLGRERLKQCYPLWKEAQAYVNERMGLGSAEEMRNFLEQIERALDLPEE